MPQLGESVTEGTVTRWLKRVGDAVAEDELLFEVTTDKVDSEVPSAFNGTGYFGTYLSAPIINQPQVAVLSVDAVEKRVVVTRDDAIAVRHRVFLCLSWDHRAFDGSTAARFLAHAKATLETRDWTSLFGP